MFNTHKNKQMVRDFIRGINPELVVQFAEDEFYCIIGEGIINVTFDADPEGDRLYSEFVKDHFDISASPFLLGILHEVGHIYTFNEKADEERSLLYHLLQVSFKEEEYEAYTRMYFAIPSEFEATRWGVKYYLSHKDYCDNFLKEIGYEA